MLPRRPRHEKVRGEKGREEKRGRRGRERKRRGGEEGKVTIAVFPANSLST